MAVTPKDNTENAPTTLHNLYFQKISGWELSMGNLLSLSIEKNIACFIS